VGLYWQQTDCPLYLDIHWEKLEVVEYGYQALIGIKLMLVGEVEQGKLGLHLHHHLQELAEMEFLVCPGLEPPFPCPHCLVVLTQA